MKTINKKVGGQLGHQGLTLKMVLTTEHNHVHDVDACSRCGDATDTIRIKI